MRACCVGWLIQAMVGQLGWLWSAVPEAFGVSGVGRVEGLLPLGADLARGAEMH